MAATVTQRIGALDVAHRLGDRVARMSEVLEETAGMVSAAIAFYYDAA